MLPSELMNGIVSKARILKKTIVLPDATDERAIQAAKLLADGGIAAPILIGNPRTIEEQAKKNGTLLSGIRVVDPATSEKLSDFSHVFFNLRKEKGIKFEDAQKQMTNPLFFGAMMVREGMADGSVAGSLSTTGDVLRAAIQVIGLAENITVVSSFFLIIFPQQVYSFADCAVVRRLLQNPGVAAESRRATDDLRRRLETRICWSCYGRSR